MKLRYFNPLLFAFVAGVFVLVLASCSTSRILPEDVEDIYIQYDRNQDVNFGAEIEAKIFAVMKDGKERDITKYDKFEIDSEGLDLSEEGKIQISGRPITCGNDTVPANFKLYYKTDTAVFSSEVLLNYRGPIIIHQAGKDGIDGENQKNRSMRIVGRDGKDGKDGGDATHGGHGGSFSIHIWREDTVLMVRMLNIETYEAWCYKSFTDSTCFIDVSGGNGGVGGNGGDGSDGKDAVDSESGSKVAGNGGDGGDGGDGGNGGNAGMLNIFIHPNASEVADSLIANNLAGIGGRAGDFGDPGQGGRGSGNEDPGWSGVSGALGVGGVNGTEAPAPNYTIVEFNYSNFYYGKGE